MGHQRRARAMADDGTSVAPSPTAPTAPVPPTGDRDAFIDFVRAFSLLVVVAWHWVFTIIIWTADGPRSRGSSAPSS